MPFTRAYRRGRIAIGIFALLSLYFFARVVQYKGNAQGSLESSDSSALPSLYTNGGLQHEIEGQSLRGSLSHGDPVFSTSQLITSSSTLPEKTSQSRAYKIDSTVPPPTPITNHTKITLLVDYAVETTQNAWCVEHFGMDYLHNLVQTSTQYCDTEQSSSGFTCFHSQTEEKGRVDTFCISMLTNLHRESMKFRLNCSLIDIHSEERKSKGVRVSSPKNAQSPSSPMNQGNLMVKTPKVADFATYWTGTGPAAVIPQYFDFKADIGKPTASNATKIKEFLVIVKRERSTNNLWHSLMEVFSLTLTLDVLQIYRDESRDEASWTFEDVNNTQVLLLDDHPEGPSWDLWRLMAKRPTLRASHIPVHTDYGYYNVIIPLQGSSNTLWQGDWEQHTCKDSRLLQIFRQRVLDFYSIDIRHDSADRPIVITFLQRTGSRQLQAFKSHVDELQAHFPYITMKIIEFEGVPLKQQIETIQDTDILVGVHGAGLTHTIFLPPQSTVVEIEPPTINHKGFRNLANILKHQYFSTHAFLDNEKLVSGNWQIDHVRIPKDQFMYLMDLAIKTQYNTDSRSVDVV